MFLQRFPGVPRWLTKCSETQEHVKEAEPRNRFAKCYICWLPLLVVLWELRSGHDGYIDHIVGQTKHIQQHTVRFPACLTEKSGQVF